MTVKPQEPTPSPMLTAIQNCISSQKVHLEALQKLSDLFHGKVSLGPNLTMDKITVAYLKDRARPEVEPNACNRDALLGAARIVEGKNG